MMNSAAWDAVALLIGEPKPAYLTVSVSGSGGGSPSVSGSVALNPSPGSIGTNIGGAAHFKYQSTAYDSAEDTMHVTSVNGTLTYTVTGVVTQPDNQTLLVWAQTIFYVETNFHILGQNAQNESGNLIDQVVRATYQIAPAARQGDVTVTMTALDRIADDSQAVNFRMDIGDALTAVQAGVFDAVSGLENLFRGVLSKSTQPQPKVRTQVRRTQTGRPAS